MILDSSAIVAVLLREPGWRALVEKLGAAEAVGAGAPTLAETGIVLTARIGDQARTVLARFVQETALTVIPFGEAHWRAALDAYRRFGRGRHRAGLNLGDCLAYAAARLAGQPLLYVGDDFSHTDLPAA